MIYGFEWTVIKLKTYKISIKPEKNSLNLSLNGKTPAILNFQLEKIQINSRLSQIHLKEKNST